jgi:hypothetical protein
MMLGVNFWSVLFALAYLLFNLGAKGWEEADIGGVVRFVVNYPDVRLHLLAFALSNAIGQVSSRRPRHGSMGMAFST